MTRSSSPELLKFGVGLWGKCQSPNQVLGRQGLGSCGDCAVVPTIPHTFPDHSGFGDHRGRATYLTALRIKGFPISKGRFPRRATYAEFSIKQTDIILFHFRRLWCVRRSNQGSKWAGLAGSARAFLQCPRSRHWLQ